MTLTRILFEPDTYFQEESLDTPGVKPLRFVIATAVLGLLAAWLQTYAAGQAVANAESLSLTMLAITGSITGLFTPFLTWLAYTVLVFAIARLLGGESGFRPTTRVVAIGFLPTALGSLIAFVATVVAVNGTGAASVDNIRQFLAAVNAHPARRVARSVNNLCLVWSATVWVFGARELHDLELWKACVAGGVPAAVGLGLYLFA